MNRILFCLGSVILLLTSHAAAWADSSTYATRVKTSKKVYYEGDAVELSIATKNVSGLTIPFSYNSGFHEAEFDNLINVKDCTTGQSTAKTNYYANLLWQLFGITSNGVDLHSLNHAGISSATVTTALPPGAVHSDVAVLNHLFILSPNACYSVRVSHVWLGHQNNNIIYSNSVQFKVFSK